MGNHSYLTHFKRDVKRSGGGSDSHVCITRPVSGYNLSLLFSAPQLLIYNGCKGTKKDNVITSYSLFFSKCIPYSQAHVPVEMVPSDIFFNENAISRTEIQLHCQRDFEDVFQSCYDIGAHFHTITQILIIISCATRIPNVPNPHFPIIAQRNSSTYKAVQAGVG